MDQSGQHGADVCVWAVGMKGKLFMAEECVFSEQSTLKTWVEMSGFPPNPAKKILPHQGLASVEKTRHVLVVAE